MSDQMFIHSQKVVNVFGAVGYSLLIVLYSFAIMLGLFWVLNAGYMEPVWSTPNAPQQVAEPGIEESQSSILALGIAYIATGFTVVTSMFVLVALPYWLGRLGSRSLKRLIRMCQIPVTRISLLIGKLIACGLAIVPSSIMVMNDIGAVYVAIAAFAISLLAAIVFILQHSIAGMSRFEAKSIW